MGTSENKIGFALFAVLLSLLLCVFGASCGSGTKIALDKTEISLQTGDTAEIQATNRDNGVLEWSIGDEQIASIVVGENKIDVTALKPGTTVICVKVGGKIAATCKLTVEAKDFYVNLPQNCLVLKKNQEASVRILYSGTFTDTLTWTSSDETVATVKAQNEIAVVTALKRGECEITVSSGSVVKTFTVIVGITG